MDEQGFTTFMKNERRSASAIHRCITFVGDFEGWLRENRARETADEAEAADLEAFARWWEQQGESVNTHLWALGHYFRFTANEPLRETAAKLRGRKIERQPFALKEFRGVAPEHAARLAAGGITNVDEMLKAGRTTDARRTLSERTGVPIGAVLELVKLSDLARIPGVKGVRARLYYDAGFDTLDKLAASDPAGLREELLRFVERTGFDGVAPWPKEARGAVTTARKLPRIVEY
jgi:hypothetical protein